MFFKNLQGVHDSCDTSTIRVPFRRQIFKAWLKFAENPEREENLDPVSGKSFETLINLIQVSYRNAVFGMFGHCLYMRPVWLVGGRECCKRGSGRMGTTFPTERRNA